MIPFKRKVLLEASYRSLRPVIQDVAALFKPDLTMLDVGSGDGFIALKMGEDFKAGKIHLVDRVMQPEVSLPPHAEFHLMDVMSSGLLENFQRRIHLITCVAAFHEFSDPIAATLQLLTVLPTEGVMVIIDNSEHGWIRQRQESIAFGYQQLRHYEDDIARIRTNDLETDRGIRNFWEQQVSPGIPGETSLTFMGDTYMFRYLAREWGDVKEPPEWMHEEVETFRRSQS